MSKRVSYAAQRRAVGKAKRPWVYAKQGDVVMRVKELPRLDMVDDEGRVFYYLTRRNEGFDTSTIVWFGFRAPKDVDRLQDKFPLGSTLHLSTAGDQLHLPVTCTVDAYFTPRPDQRAGQVALTGVPQRLVHLFRDRAVKR